MGGQDSNSDVAVSAYLLLGESRDQQLTVLIIKSFLMARLKKINNMVAQNRLLLLY